MLVILASFLALVLFTTFAISHAKRKDNEIMSAYWERERQANMTRKKPLDNLDYITIPFEDLPMDTMKEDPKIMEYHQILKDLSDGPIVNFTGETNTDLKLAYGVGNLETLIRYDQCYTMLARTLQQWADLLYQNHYSKEAQSILEFAIETGSDVSGSYKLLAQMYHEDGEDEKIKALILLADMLKTAIKPSILANLNSYFEDGSYEEK